MKREATASNVGAIVLFDGVCNLCSAAVRFAIRRDRRERFRFASLQSAAGQRLAAEHRCADPLLTSMALIVDGQCHRKSRAALELMRRLDAPWPVFYALVIVPRAIADRLYDFAGARRYRWFGKRGTCWAPTDKLRERFMD